MYFFNFQLIYLFITYIYIQHCELTVICYFCLMSVVALDHTKQSSSK